MTNILTPASNQKAAEIVRDAADKRTPIALRGGGTKSQIGTPMQVEQIVSSTGLCGITLYEPSEMVIAAKAGTPLAEIEAELKKHNQRLAFDPITYQRALGSDGMPTIGAIAACNLSGSRRIAFGAARDSLIGIEMINGKGEIIKNGGRVMKNVTGYDLTKLVCGSWGTLGLLTEVCFKVQPKPEQERTLLINGLYEDEAVPLMCKVMGSPFEITSAAHLYPDARKDDVRARTILRIEGFAESLNYRVQELQDLLMDACDADNLDFGEVVHLDDQESKEIWDKVADLSIINDDDRQLLWKISVKPTDAPTIGRYLHNQMDASLLYDWSGGLIYAAFECHHQNEQDGSAQEIRNEVAKLGGHATLIRAPELTRSAGVSFQPLSNGVSKLHKAVKQSFDPFGIFNPGLMASGEER